MRSWHRIEKEPSGEDLLVFWPSCFSPNLQPTSGLIALDPQLCSTPQPKVDNEVLRFLDRQTARSIVFITFGSYSWVPTPRQTELLFNVLGTLGLGALVIKPELPYVKDANTDHLEFVRSGIERMGDKGMLVDWAPQEDVLLHQVSLVSYVVSLCLICCVSLFRLLYRMVGQTKLWKRWSQLFH